MIDIHQHVVFGIDDGPRTQELSEAMLDAANRQGIYRVIATPHVCPGRAPFDLKAYADKLNGLNLLMQKKGSALRLLPGAEVMYTPQTLGALLSGSIPTMAFGRHVLTEFSPHVEPEELFRAMRELLNNGYRPILAHAERCLCLHGNWKRIEQLRMMDVLIQINARSVLRSGRLTGPVFVRRLLKRNAVDFVASDAHDPVSRPVCLADAYAFLQKHYGPEQADRLTWRNQQCLISEAFFPSADETR